MQTQIQSSISQLNESPTPGRGRHALSRVFRHRRRRGNGVRRVLRVSSTASCSYVPSPCIQSVCNYLLVFNLCSKFDTGRFIFTHRFTSLGVNCFGAKARETANLFSCILSISRVKSFLPFVNREVFFRVTLRPKRKVKVAISRDGRSGRLWK